MSSIGSIVSLKAGIIKTIKATLQNTAFKIWRDDENDRRDDLKKAVQCDLDIKKNSFVSTTV